MRYLIACADAVEGMSRLADNSVDSIVTDPQYGLSDISMADIIACLSAWVRGERYRHNKRGFMGLEWDGWVPGPEVWREALRILKPGGYLLAFAGARTQDLATVAIRLGGFDVVDVLMWVHHGMPKTANSLRPCYDPIVKARKPYVGTIKENIQMFGTGGLNIEACRIPIEDRPDLQGRWPGNFIHDGSDEVIELFPQAGGQQAPITGREPSGKMGHANTFGRMDRRLPRDVRGDAGSAARFYYCPRASKADRGEGNTHPTVKPTELMRWLVRLETPLAGVVLDMFCGSGSTGKAALLEGMHFIGIDRDGPQCEIAVRRCAEVVRDCVL